MPHDDTLQERRSTHDVTNTVDVSSVVAVRNAVSEIFNDIYPTSSFDAVWLAFHDFEQLFNGEHPEYHAVETTYRECCKQAIRDAFNRDPRVFMMGEDIGHYGGCYAVTKGLLDEFGTERLRDTPLSESAFVGAGIGAALNGMRPIVEVMTVNFSLLALDQILNNAATIRHMSGGQFSVPLVIRMATGAGRQLAAQHSHSLEGWYTHIPGIKVLRSEGLNVYDMLRYDKLILVGDAIDKIEGGL